MSFYYFVYYLSFQFLKLLNKSIIIIIIISSSSSSSSSNCKK